MIRIEGARFKRFFLLGSVLAIALLSAGLSTLHLVQLRRGREEELARLRDVIMESKRVYLRDAVMRTIGEIEIERREAREALGVRPGEGAAAERADALAKERLRARIREARLADGGYIWVNRVLDYAGGEGYAVREIHPNLPETEGMPLSTSMRDAAGGLPYLEELEGVKRDGELFFEYYFKRLDSEAVGRKLSFAKLYPDFDWIVATGAYLDEVEAFVSEARSRAEAAYALHLRSIAATTALALLGASLVILLFERRVVALVAGYNEAIAEGERSLLEERRRVEEAYALMKDQAERDPLTGLRNRRSALERLEEEAARVRRGGEGFCLAMADLDRFKDVNDEQGHDCGDAALKAAAELFTASLRPFDLVARWGGEEFLLILADIGIEEAFRRLEALREAQASSRIPCILPPRPLTLTIGLARFEAGEEPLDALRRADQALYRGKRLGRNRVVLAEPPEDPFPGS